MSPLSSILALFLASATPARAGSITPEMDRLLIHAIDCIYRMKFEEAEDSARKAMALSPGHPYPYFSLLGVAWTRYVYGADQSDPSLLGPFEASVNKTIEVGERWLKAHPKDPQALMAISAAYGMLSRMDVTRHEWLKAYWHGRKAIGLTRDAIKADPGFYDAYLGVGMYDYYTDVYPRVIGALAKIVLRGNRLRGIETLKMVAQKGHFSRNNAKILLVEIFTEDAFGARDPKKAVELMKELRAEYPDSAMMQSAELVALYDAGRFDDVVAGAQDYLERIRRGLYNPIERGKALVILGCARWALGQTEPSLDAFREAESVLYQGRPSRWSVWGTIRAAQLEDSLGRRLEAVRDYKAALAAPDLWDFRGAAKAGLSRPHQGGPGPIPPP